MPSPWTHSSSRYALLAITLVQSAFFAGIIFGWPAFAQILVTEGVYMPIHCQNLTRACVMSQHNDLSLVYTLSSSLFIFGAFPAGLLLDRLGPATVGAIGGCLISAGMLLIAIGPEILLVPGFALLGLGGCCAYTTSLKASFLVHHSHRVAVLTGINCLFDVSPATALLWATVHGMGVSRTYLFGALFMVSACVFTAWSLLWMLNAEHLQQAMREYAKVPAHERSSATARLSALPLRAQLRRPELWLVVVWMGVHILRSTFFTGFVYSLLLSLGDHDGAYTRALLLVLPLTVVFGPLVSHFLRRRGYVAGLHLVTLLGMLVNALTLVPHMQLQLLTFVVYAAFRSSLYPVGIGCLSQLFGPATLGSTLGVVFVVSGVCAAPWVELAKLGHARPVMASL